MFPRILIPLDGSELSGRILWQVRRLLQVADPEVVLLRVIDPEESAKVAPRLRLNTAREVSRRLCEDLREQGVNARSVVSLGEPGHVILEHARRASLVAMTTHGRDGVVRWVRGSVAERVLRRCPVPLFLCNPRSLREESATKRIGRILVPLDGSLRSAEALPLAASLARPYGAEVVVLRVHEVFVHADLEDGLGRYAHASVVGHHVEPCSESHAVSLRGDGLRARAVCVSDVGAASAILAAVEQEGADVVAMTTHGRTGLERMLMGSITEDVLRRSPVPVLVKRSSAADAAEAEDTLASAHC